MSATAAEMAVLAIVRRAEERYEVERTKLMAATDRMFGGLMLGQWAFAVVMALLVSPWAWEGKERTGSTCTSGRPSCWGGSSAACR
jgi:hypothetical protein